MKRTIETVAITLSIGLMLADGRAAEVERVFPGKTWAKLAPAEVGLDAEKLREFSQFVGGRGCVVRHGYLVYSWGDVGRRADVASASKPLYSHFLFAAVESGKVAGLDEKVVRWEPRLKAINKDLGFKDAGITWRNFANQTSCYQLKLKMLSRLKQDDLFEFLSGSSVSRAGFHRVDRVVPDLAS